jgi:hypothetical protein
LKQVADQQQDAQSGKSEVIPLLTSRNRRAGRKKVYRMEWEERKRRALTGWAD